MRNSPAHPPMTVAILLGVFNGEPYLPQQLASIAAQTYPHWQLIASDDGSSDGSVDCIRDWAAMQAKDVRIQTGPARGFAANFLSLLLDEAISANCYAFCDQDDVWHADKLARAIAWLAQIPSSQPALYGSRTRLIDATGQPLGYSPRFRKPPGFRNALVHNVAGGNSMVMNRAARALLVQAGMRDVPLHDWWCYLVVSACGGVVHYDAQPSLDYRQHGQNLIGNPSGPARFLAYWQQWRRGEFFRWNREWQQLLREAALPVTPEHRALLDALAHGPQGGLGRLAKLRALGLYAQSWKGQLLLAIAAFFRRI